MSTCVAIASSDWSLVPVILPPGSFKFFTSFAANGSVTAEKTIGVDLVVLAKLCAEGVAIAKTRSLSSANCLEIFFRFRCSP